MLEDENQLISEEIRTDAELVEDAPKAVSETPVSTPMVVEFEANPRVQFEENYKQASENQVSFYLNMFAAVGIVSLLQTLTTGKTSDSSLLYTQAILCAAALIIAKVFSQHKAKQLVKRNYVLKDGILSAQGTNAEHDWQIPISNIRKARLCTNENNREKLLVSSNEKTFVLTGLENARTLLQSLPEGVRADDGEVYNKLLSAAQSVHECKDAEEIERLREPAKRGALIAKKLDGAANTIVLQTDFSSYRLMFTFTLCFLIPLLAGAFLGYAEFCLPLLAIVIFRSVSELIPFLKTSECIYVFSPDALFEVNCKEAAVNTITLNRVSLLASEDGEFSLAVDGRRLPAKMSSASLDSVYPALKNYPRT